MLKPATELADTGRGTFGIDTAAHRGSLDHGGPTIAVIPAGLDHTYPAANRELHARIAEHGLLLSELAPGTPISRQNVLARNRIIAALSGATIIVEGATRSGTMHTAGQALALGRLVGAVPGPITSTTSGGPHLLLKQGAARLVTDAADGVEMLSSNSAAARPAPPGPAVAMTITARHRPAQDATTAGSSR